ncbi:hypothetical protein LTR28_006796 [Elasticomyces elasticus]|nr:hypothetical protein LTR28_006796 [Elasticomyces elasticus]
MASSGRLIEQLTAHLDALDQDPSTALDVRLLDTCALVLPGSVGEATSTLITRLSETLPKLLQDPSPAIPFLMKLLEPYSFTDVLAFQSVDFVGGLQTAALPYNDLVLSLLQKAASKASDAAILAGRPEVIAALVTLWLCTPDAGVADKAGRVLYELLKVDRETPQGANCEHLASRPLGLVWRRVFRDRDIYGLIFDICTLKPIKKEPQLSKSQKTLAQARLMDWLPALGAQDWAAITQSYHRDIESQYGVKEAGLLEFAALHMVDFKDDVLMHRCLIDFFAKLLRSVTQPHHDVLVNVLQFVSRFESDPGRSKRSVSLNFLINNRLHSRSLAYYLDPTSRSLDPIDVKFLYSASADYIATYASTNPEHFLISPDRKRVLDRLSMALDLTPARWAHSDPPRSDLHVLCSLPRITLLPQGDGPYGPSAWTSSPLSLLPSKMSNADVFNALEVVFHGPPRTEVITFPTQPSDTNQVKPTSGTESAAARALYFLYINNNHGFFRDLIAHAETVALKETALAAISLITAISTANWAVFQEAPSEMRDTDFLTEAKFRSMLPDPLYDTPRSGALAIISPPSLEYTLPYLLRPAQSFSNLVGGRGDSESAAYRIAVAKFDALKALHAMVMRLDLEDPGKGFEVIVGALAKRISQGPWSKEGEVGGRVGTMEM